MSSAGQQLVAGRIPGERIETEEITADSATFTTTETAVATVVAKLVQGRTYRVRLTGAWLSSASGDRIVGRIREDTVSGAVKQANQTIVEVSGSSIGWLALLEVEYTATATGNKTFVATGVQAAGTGNCFLDASSAGPAYLYVDYIRG